MSPFLLPRCPLIARTHVFRLHRLWHRPAASLYGECRLYGSDHEGIWSMNLRQTCVKCIHETDEVTSSMFCIIIVVWLFLFRLHGTYFLFNHLQHVISSSNRRGCPQSSPVYQPIRTSQHLPLVVPGNSNGFL